MMGSGLILLFIVSTSSLVVAQSVERIFNGFEATYGQFPYQALLLQDTYKNTTDYCGGSIISDNYILTAAHCSYRTTRTKVYLGVTDSHDPTNVQQYIVYPNGTFVHELYDPNTFQNDIAILRLPSKITYTARIQPIALPKREWSNPDYFNNFLVTASGWGKTNDDEKGIHRSLQYRSLYKMPQAQCAQIYQQVLPVTNNMLCTGKTRTVYSGPCQGDSGGPLTVRTTLGQFVIGAVSWSAGKCSEEYPIVYVNIAYYLPWISSITGIKI